MMTFGRFRQGSDLFEPMAEINVTPLVDVTLVLLVVFIIAAPLLTYAIKLDLPAAQAAPASPAPAAIDVAIDAGIVRLAPASPPTNRAPPTPKT